MTLRSNKCVLTHYLINPCSNIHIKNPINSLNYARNSVRFMKPRLSLQYSQQPSTGSNLNPTNPNPSKLFFFAMNVIPPLYILFRACLFQEASFLHVSHPSFGGAPVLTCMLHALCMSSSSLNLSAQYSLTVVCINNCTFLQLAFSRQ